jgi:peptidoglycan/xylan/chitin deacetylase (PgdA/CDA1 family)
MYHYVRPPLFGRFPNLKTLALDSFVEQLDFFQQNYQIVDCRDVLYAFQRANTITQLPDRPLVLTFDDGLRDHFEFVMPQLERRGLTASFFPVRAAVCDQQLLDVQQVQILVSLFAESKELLQRIRAEVISRGVLPSAFDSILGKCSTKLRFDDDNVAAIKSLLQYALPAALRQSILKTLLQELVDESFRTLAREFYLTSEQLLEMQAKGMHIGGHGDQHLWLGKATRDEQVTEIQRTYDFLKDLGALTLDRCWVMCYPFGSHNKDTIEILTKAGCGLGLTTKPGVARLDIDDALLIPRQDCNDFRVRALNASSS